MLKETVGQLRKDMMLCDLDFEVRDTSIDDTLTDLSTITEHLLTKYPEKFMNLVYRIDLPQNITDMLIGSGPVNFSNIARGILVRCYQKVWLRNQYSK